MAVAWLLLVGPPVLHHPRQPRPALSQLSLPALRCRKPLWSWLAKAARLLLEPDVADHPLPQPSVIPDSQNQIIRRCIITHGVWQMWAICTLVVSDCSDLGGKKCTWPSGHRVVRDVRLESKNKKKVFTSSCRYWPMRRTSSISLSWDIPVMAVVKMWSQYFQISCLVMRTWVDEVVSVTCTDFQKRGRRERTRMQEVTESAGGGWWRRAPWSLFCLTTAVNLRWRIVTPRTAAPPSSFVFAGDTASQMTSNSPSPLPVISEDLPPAVFTVSYHGDPSSPVWRRRCNLHAVDENENLNFLCVNTRGGDGIVPYLDDLSRRRVTF